MVKLGVLLTQHHRLLSVAAILDVFENVNRFSEQDGGGKLFDIHLVSASPPASEYGGYPVDSMDQPSLYGLIVVPAFAMEDMSQAIDANSRGLEWLQRQYHAGAEMASVCTGAFLLAAAGLLDQRAATTHMHSARAFARAFPRVKLKEQAIVTQDNGIYTSGGATSSFHLLLLLVENYCGRSMAIRIAKYFAIDMDREHQTYFGSFRPVDCTQDQLVSELQQRIRKHYSSASTIEQLLNGLPASRRNMVRRFKLMTGYTPIEYLQKTRIEAAKKTLEQSAGGVLESMIAAGYSDEKAFRQLFKKNVGMTPSAYRSKYNGKSRELYN